MTQMIDVLWMQAGFAYLHGMPKNKTKRENVNKLTFNRTASDIHINISNKKRFFEYHHSRRVIKSN